MKYFTHSYIQNDRTRKLERNVFTKIKTLTSDGVSDDRLNRARKKRREALTLLDKQNPPHERIQDLLVDVRDLLNRAMTKEYGSASLNKVCDWR